MTVLLTGATGFVGLNIAHALLADGHEIVLFAPSKPPAFDWLKRAVFVPGDVRVPGDVARAFAAAPITHLIHAAAVTPDAQAEADDPAAIAAVNLVGSLLVLQAAAQAKLARALVLSSGAIYGDVTSTAPLDEATTPPNPATLYGITKLAAEQSARRLAELYGLDTVVVRLGPCFGAREYPGGNRQVMSPHWQVVERALSGEPCVLPREMRADWIDATDAGRAIAALLLAPALPHHLFHLGGGVPTTLSAWCDAVAQLRPGFRWRIDPVAATIRTPDARAPNPLHRPAAGRPRLAA